VRAEGIVVRQSHLLAQLGRVWSHRDGRFGNRSAGNGAFQFPVVPLDRVSAVFQQAPHRRALDAAGHSQVNRYSRPALRAKLHCPRFQQVHDPDPDPTATVVRMHAADEQGREVAARWSTLDPKLAEADQRAVIPHGDGVPDRIHARLDQLLGQILGLVELLGAVDFCQQVHQLGPLPHALATQRIPANRHDPIPSNSAPLCHSTCRSQSSPKPQSTSDWIWVA